LVNRIVVALDFPDIESARVMAEVLAPDVAGFKVGLELVAGEGPSAITEIARVGRPVFADMKLHDIPNTVAGATRRIADAGARWVTVHASGGAGMMEAAVEAMGATGGVLAVTVLTSLSEADLEATGMNAGLESQVVGLAELAAKAGVEGLVCAPTDVAAVRSKGIEQTIFTPGIRVGAAHDDQKRVGTPAEAVSAGADYIVIGRPITRAADPGAAAREITASLAGLE
jgi:orotidine-5'-phosphate decarboxylase